MLKKVMVFLLALGFLIIPISATSQVHAAEEKHTIKKVDEETKKPIKGAHFKIEARKPVTKKEVPITGNKQLLYGICILITSGALAVPYVLKVRKSSF